MLLVTSDKEIKLGSVEHIAVDAKKITDEGARPDPKLQPLVRQPTAPRPIW